MLVLLVSQALVCASAALRAAASRRRRLRFLVPAFSRSRCCRVLVGAAALPLVGLALALRHSRSCSCSPRCWLPAVLPGLWKQRSVLLLVLQQVRVGGGGG